MLCIVSSYVENGQALGSVDVLTNLNKLPRTVQIDRLILPIISLSISIGVIIYSEVSKVHFATYLLYTLIGNVLGTCIYYIGIMKVSRYAICLTLSKHKRPNISATCETDD